MSLKYLNLQGLFLWLDLEQAGWLAHWYLRLHSLLVSSTALSRAVIRWTGLDPLATLSGRIILPCRLPADFGRQSWLGHTLVPAGHRPNTAAHAPDPHANQRITCKIRQRDSNKTVKQNTKLIN